MNRIEKGTEQGVVVQCTDTMYRHGYTTTQMYFPLKLRNSAGILEQSMKARNRDIGIGLSYLPARLHSLAELVPWNRFLGSLKV